MAADRDNKDSTTVMINGSGGNTAYVNLKDMEPVSETNAVLKGATAGAILGVIPAGVTAVMKSESAAAIAREALDGGGARGMSAMAREASTKAGGKAALMVLGGTAAVGAIVSYLRAHTHNKWSDRVAAKTLENQQSAPQR
jgi:hypothetical protein